MVTRFIHIGYGKAGSTTMQKYFFRELPNVLYLGIPFISEEMDDVVRIDIIRKSEILYDSSKVKSIFEPYLIEAENNDNYQAVGLSYETLCSPFYRFQVDNYLIARRLQEVFGDAKIIIVVRNQFDMLRSIYTGLVREGAFFSFNKFLEGVYFLYHTWTVPQLFYYEMSRCYQNIFGKDNVKIVLFENFISNPSQVMSEICSFIDIPKVDFKIGHEGKSYNDLSLFTVRILNYLVRQSWGGNYYSAVGGRIFGRWWNQHERELSTNLYLHSKWRSYLDRSTDWINKRLNLPKAKIKFTPEWKTRITDLYKESNLKLMNETGLNLEKYNYPL